MNKKEYEIKRYGLVSERQRLMHILEAMEDFPVKAIVDRYYANQKEIIDLDGQFKSDSLIHSGESK
jgi:hypothetical protein